MHLFHEQHAIAVGIGAVIDSDVGDNIGLVPVFGFVGLNTRNLAALRHPAYATGNGLLVCFVFQFFHDIPLAIQLKRNKRLAINLVCSC